MTPIRSGDVVIDSHGDMYYITNVETVDSGVILNAHPIDDEIVVLHINDIQLLSEEEHLQRIKAVNSL